MKKEKEKEQEIQIVKWLKKERERETAYQLHEFHHQAGGQNHNRWRVEKYSEIKRTTEKFKKKENVVWSVNHGFYNRTGYFQFYQLKATNEMSF